MRSRMVLVLLASVTRLGDARCHLDCSGHGNCGKKDKCVCWNGWTGNACDGRICPFARKWGGAPEHADDLRYYAECGGVGACDRTTGACDGMPGFTGQGCRRAVCPNGCSGHGYCRDIVDMGRDTSPIVGGVWDRGYNLWDARSSRVCRCDCA